MKPHDETWIANGHAITTAEGRAVGGLIDADANRLAAQAPTMARLLLATQGVDDDLGAHCETCGGRKDGGPLGKNAGHLPSCELVAVLRAAGVLP